MSAPPVMDRLPVEVRLKIFELVLHSSNGLLQVRDWEQDHNGHSLTHEVLCMSFFTASRKTYLEARDAFFQTNTIHVSRKPHEYSNLQFARHVQTGQFLGYDLEMAVHDADAFSARCAAYFEQLPCLQNLMIPLYPIHGRDVVCEIRAGLRRNDDVARVVPRKLGLYEVVLKTAPRGRIWLQDQYFIAQVKTAQRLQASFDITQLSRLYTHADEYGEWPDWGERLHVKDVLFALCVRCYEASVACRRKLPAAETYTESEMVRIRWFERWCVARAWHSHLTTLWRGSAMHERLPDNVSLLQISPTAGYDEDLVEWASDVACTIWVSIQCARGIGAGAERDVNGVSLLEQLDGYQLEEDGR